MIDPVVAEVTRGGMVESLHRGAWAVVGPGDRLLASAGSIDRPVFPRSAIKAFQCLPAVEAGVVEALPTTANKNMSALPARRWPRRM
jgi:L-asparaginase II